MPHVGRAAGPSTPASTVDLVRVLRIAPRIAARLAGGRVIAQLVDDTGIIEVALPARLRGRVVRDLRELAELEAERRIERAEVLDGAEVER